MLLQIIKRLYRLVKWYKYLSQNNFDKSKWYFVLNYGIGDTYIVSSLLHHILNKKNEIVLIITKDNHVFIPKLFNSQIQVIHDSKVPVNLIIEFGKFIKGQPIILHPNVHLDSRLLNLIGQNNFSLINIYKLLLGLRLDSKPKSPKKIENMDEVINLFDKHKLIIGRTVLLCPQANSIDLINPNFWLALASRIREIGLCPVFLNPNFNTQDFKIINFPLEYSLTFTEIAGNIISLRSGFCDLIATSKAKKIILYHDKIWHQGKLIESTSLERMELSDGENLFELSCEFNRDYDIRIKEIIKYL